MARYFLDSSKITHITQKDERWKDLVLSDGEHSGTIGSIGCAFTCACMCVKQSPKTVWEGGIKWTYWKQIAEKYSRKHDDIMSNTLDSIIDLLKENRPAIVQSKKSSHWVVVYGFEGDVNNPTAADFTCFDPEYKMVKLNKSYGYDGVHFVRTIY